MEKLVEACCYQMSNVERSGGLNLSGSREGCPASEPECLLSGPVPNSSNSRWYNFRVLGQNPPSRKLGDGPPEHQNVGRSAAFSRTVHLLVFLDVAEPSCHCPSCRSVSSGFWVKLEDAPHSGKELTPDSGGKFWSKKIDG